MSDPYQAQKKRPPPIEIPPPYPQRPVVPGPNAFAIAERAAQAQAEENRKRAEAALQQRALARAEDYASESSSLEDERIPELPRANSMTQKLSTKETYSNLVDQVLKSPRKSAHSYKSLTTGNRHGSETRSKYPERGYHTLGNASSRQLNLEGLTEGRTSRAEIEAQKERKLFKMMGQVPETPNTGVIPDNHVNINDFRQDRSGSQSSKKKFDVEISTKSPKKKIFGVSIPFSRAVMPHEPTPPMPFKAAKVMGASPPARKFTPLSKDFLASSAVPRSDTSKSLPNKLFDQDRHHPRRQRSPIHEGPSRARPSRKSPTKPAVFSHEKTLQALEGAPKVPEMPPIPPRKDSLKALDQFPEIQEKIDALKAVKAKSKDRTISQLLRPPTPTKEPQDFKDNGMKLFVPSAPKLDPVPSKGGESPSKYCPTGVGERAELVEREHVFSARGHMDYSYCTIEEEDETVRSAPLKSPDIAPLPTHHYERRSAPATPSATDRVPQSCTPSPVKRSPQLEYLRATVYVPPTKPVRKAYESPVSDIEDPFVLADRPDASDPTPYTKSGSIPIVFQGDANEIDTESVTAKPISYIAPPPPFGSTPQMLDSPEHHKLAARVMEELRIKPSGSHHPVRAPSQGALQHEQSSSQLTDMLSGVSPSKADFQEYNRFSAVPSPLRKFPYPPNGRIPGSPHDHPLPTGATIPPPPKTMPMHDHFFMTNEHIDMVALSLYDWVQSCTNQGTKAAASKNDQLKMAVEQQFNDIKSQVNSIGEKADHNGNQSHNLSVQLDKLKEFIKAEVVGPMAAQAEKVNGLEQGMKELQKTVRDLQASGPGSHNHVPASGFPPSPGQSYPLPNARSQPSLAGYYDSNPPTMPSAPSGPSDFRGYGYGNNPLSRSSHGRENRENSHPYPNTGNPYRSPPGSFNNFGGGGSGGYQPSYSGYNPMQDQPSYGYNHNHNQGLPK